MHSLFHNDEWRTYWLNRIREEKGLPVRSVIALRQLKDQKYDQLATHVKNYLDWERVKEMVNKWGQA
jgi:adenosylcobyric acid synthase